MTKNMGAVDRILRILIAIGVAYLYFTGIVSGAFGIILIILAAIFVVTSLVGRCGLYTLFGIKTCKN